MEPLERRFVLSASLGLIQNGLPDFLSSLQGELNTVVFAAPAPLIGDQLASQESDSGQFAKTVAAMLGDDWLQSDPGIQDVIDGLNTALGDLIEGGSIAVNDAGDVIQFQLTLVDTIEGAVDVDLALGADPIIEPLLGIDNKVDVSADWTFELLFGVSQDGFFIDTAADNELEVIVEATLPDLDAKGKAGVFGALITAAEPSMFNGTYDVDLRDANTDNRLFTAEFPELELEATLTGSGDVNLHIDASFIPDFVDAGARDALFNLVVTADAAITYNFQSADTQDSPFGNPVIVDYQNIELDLGTFFSEFVDPTVERIQEVLEPLTPVVDFLTDPVPVISQLSGDDVTVLDLAATVVAGNAELKRPIERAKTVVNIIDNILELQTPVAQGLGQLDLGTFEAKVTVDLDANEASGVQKTDEEVADELLEKLKEGAASKEFFTNFGATIQFPFLEDPNIIFAMLMGDTTADLVTFGIDFSFGFEFGYTYPVIPGLLNAELGFAFEAALNLDAGYDTFGVAALTNSLDFNSETSLEQSVDASIHRLADGFYFDDHNSSHAQDGDVDITDDTNDQPELTLTAKMSAGASVGANLLVFNATSGVKLVFETYILFDLNDLPEPQNLDQFDYVHDLLEGDETVVPTGDYDYDGRVRIGELQLIAYADPAGVFNSSGALTVGMEAFVKVTVGVGFFKFTLVDETYELFNEVIYEFDIYQLEDSRVLDGERLNAPVIGNVDNGTLTLYMGNTASSRKHTGLEGDDESPLETRESFSVTSLGPTNPDNVDEGETLEVIFQAWDPGTLQWVAHGKERFKNVKKIEAFGGTGNDRILVDDTVTVPVRFEGGDGDDLLSYAGSGVATLSGNGGNDKLLGGSRNDLLDGGTGSDELLGGAGDDDLFGGDGKDRLDGQAGLDRLEGGAGGDTYIWYVGTNKDTFVEDAGAATSPDDYDHISIRGAIQVVQAEVRDGTSGVIELDDVIELIGNGNVTVRADGDTITVDNIESIGVAAGGGADTIILGNLGHTDVQELSIDLSSSDEAGQTDGDTVIVKGSETGNDIDIIELKGERAAPPQDAPANTGKPMVQIRHRTGSTLCDAVILNSDPARDRLEISGYGGDDRLTVAAGEDGVRIQDLIAVTLDGGEGNDTLSTIYSNVDIIGGAGDDHLVVMDDVNSATQAYIDLDDDNVAVVAEAVATVPEHLMTYAGTESFELKLGSRDGNEVRVLSTIAGPVQILGSTNEQTIDHVIIPRSGDTNGLTGKLTADTISDLGYAGEISYSDLEELTFNLGSGADELTIKGASAGATNVKGNNGDDTVRLSIPDPNSLAESPFGGLTFSVETLVVEHTGTEAAAWRVAEGSVWVDQFDSSVRIVDVAGADRVTFEGGVNETDTLTVADTGPEPKTVTLEEGTVRVQPAGQVLSFNSLTFELAPGQPISSGTIESSLEVSEFPDGATVTDVEVTVDIERDSTKTNDDLRQLIDNDNLTLTLSTTDGDKSAKLQHPLLIDQDGRTVVVARLSAFNDENANDTWTLKLESTTESIGTLSSWSLQVTDNGRDSLNVPPAAFAPVITEDGEYVYSVGPLESGEDAVKVFWRNTDNGHLSLVPEESLLATESTQLGKSVAISGDTAIIGAPNGDVGGIGSAYIFQRDASGEWTQGQTLTADDGVPFNRFGTSVAIYGDTALIGAYGDDSSTGSAYVFTRTSAGWQQEQKLTADDGEQNDQFGYSVAIHGDTAVIGAHQDDGSTGSAYVFTRTRTGWQQEPKLTADDGDASNRNFGFSVAIYGETAIIIGSVPLTISDDFVGSAYVFTRTSAGWQHEQKLMADDGDVNDRFGYSVAIDGDTAVISADGDDSLSGSAYVFTRTSGVWQQEQKLTAEDGDQFNRFGVSVAIDGDTAVIGAETDDNSTGSAYVFTRTSGVWQQEQKLTADEGYRIGGSVAISGDTVVGGHPYGTPGEQGVAYAFQIPVGIGASSIAVSPDDQYLYVAQPPALPGAHSTVSVYRRQADSVSLYSVQTVDTPNALDNIAFITVSPDGKHVYAATDGEAILKYDRDSATGELSDPVQLSVGDHGPKKIVFDDAGYAYVAYADADKLQVFQRDSATGNLTAMDPPQDFVDGEEGVEGLARPVDLTLSPDQNYLYVAGRDDNAIAIFSRDAGSGGLEFVGHAGNGADGVRGLRGVASLVVTETYLFAVGEESDSLVVFNRGTDGLLTFAQRLSNRRGGIEGLENPNSAAISPDGNWLYVTSAGDGDDHLGGVAWFGVHQDVLPAAPLFVGYSGISELTVRTGSGNDRVSVLGVSDQIDTLTVETNAGDDRVVVQELPQDVTSTFRLGEGFDELDLRGTGQGADTEVHGDAGDDTIRVWGTGASSMTTIDAGDGEDTIRVAGDALMADITVRGGDPAAEPGDTLLVDTGGLPFVDEIGDPVSAPYPPAGKVYVPGASHGVEYESIEDLQRLDAPRASAGGPHTINEGESLTLDASASDLHGEMLVSVEWDVDSDGQFGDLTGLLPPQLTWSELADFGLDDSGEYQVAVRVTTSEGYDIATATVAINNVEPTLEISSGPTTVDQFTPFVINLAATDLGDDTIDQWTIDWDDGSVGHVQGNEAVATHLYAPGPHTVMVNEATDEDGTYTVNWSEDVTVEEVELLRGDSDTEEGQAYELTLDGSTAFGNPTWTINWGDGSPKDSFQGVGATLQHVFLDDSAGGTFTIQATISTDDGTYTATKRVTVANVDPVLKVAGKSSIQEGNRYTLYMLASDPGADTISSWTIAWGDGSENNTIAGSSKTISHLYADDGDFSITVTATDEDSVGGAPYQASQVASIDRPVFHFRAGLGATDHFYTLSSQPGTWDNLSQQASDAGGYLATITSEQEQRFLDEQFFSVTPPERLWVNSLVPDGDKVSWGTGESSQYKNWAENEPSAPDGGSIAMVHQSDPAPGDPLSRWAVTSGEQDLNGILELESIDKLVAWDTGDVLGVTVENAVPRVDLDGPDQVNEGSNFTLVIGPPVDGGDDQVTRYIINWGDGSDPQTVDALQDGFEHAQSVAHVYGDGDSDYTITLQLVDEDGTHDNDVDFTAHIVNVVPVLTIQGAPSVNEGSTYTLTLSTVFDPGDDLVDPYVVDWGDGPSESFASLGNVTHVYYGEAERTITVNLVDEEGTYVDAATKSVSINDVQPTIALSGADEVDANSVYTLTLGEVTDPGQPGPINVSEYVVHWGDASTDAYAQNGDVTHQYADGNFTYTITVDLKTADQAYNGSGSQSVTVNATNAGLLDVTGSGNANPFQDGILIVRFMLGQPDANLEDPALIPAGSTRTTGAAIRAHLAAAGLVLDANGDGTVNPFQDGILIVRYLLGQPDANLEDAALIPAGSTRTTGAAIRQYLDTLMPQAAEGELVAGRSGEGESILHSLLNPTDVNGDAAVTARDALNVINQLDRGDPGQQVASWRLDVNGDGDVTSLDALLVINQLARQVKSTPIAELEFSDEDIGPSAVTTVPRLPETPTKKVRYDASGSATAIDAALDSITSTARVKPGVTTRLDEVIELLSHDG